MEIELIGDTECSTDHSAGKTQAGVLFAGVGVQHDGRFYQAQAAQQFRTRFGVLDSLGGSDGGSDSWRDRRSVVPRGIRKVGRGIGEGGGLGLFTPQIRGGI